MQHIYKIISTVDGGFGQKDPYLVPVYLKLQSLELVVFVLQLDVRFSNGKSIISFFTLFHLLVPVVQFIIVTLILSFRVFCYLFILVSSMYLLFSQFLYECYLCSFLKVIRGIAEKRPARGIEMSFIGSAFPSLTIIIANVFC